MGQPHLDRRSPCLHHGQVQVKLVAGLNVTWDGDRHVFDMPVRPGDIAFVADEYRPCDGCMLDRAEDWLFEHVAFYIGDVIMVYDIGPFGLPGHSFHTMIIAGNKSVNGVYAYTLSYHTTDRKDVTLEFCAEAWKDKGFLAIKFT